MATNPYRYLEYYLYNDKGWEMAPIGVSEYTLASGVQQNAPVVVTSSGAETTSISDPWAQISGSGKYDKTGFGHFATLGDNSYDTSRDEFTLHPDSSGKLLFNKTLTENVFIEYEAGASGNYILDSLDFNPVRGMTGGGFLHVSEITDPTSLFLTTSQSTLMANGFQKATITAKLFDVDYDRVPDKSIVFEMQSVNDYSTMGQLYAHDGTVRQSDASGIPIAITETTDGNGEAHVKYLAWEEKTGVQDIKAYYLDASGVYDVVQIAQFYWGEGPFTLDISLLDTLDYLT